MMCADFIDTEMAVDVDLDVDWAEERVLIDYIVAPSGDRFVVEQEILGERSTLTKLFRKLQL